MKRALAWSLIIIGFILIVYFAFIFIVFSTADNPLLLPFLSAPIVFSIGFIVLGIILIIAGILILQQIRKTQNR
jgi:uncharacterized integral membrane protein